MWETLLGQGVDQKDLTLTHIFMRTLVIFPAALLMIRIADKRFLAHKTGFDVLVGFLLASSLSRAINASSPLMETIAFGFLVVLLHRLLAKLAVHSETFCWLIKGKSEAVLVNGKLDHQAMARNDLTEGDLIEDMRLKAHIDDFAKVREARIERNGEISVIPQLEERKS